MKSKSLIQIFVKMIEQLVEDRNIELDTQQKQSIVREAEFIKNQIADIQKKLFESFYLIYLANQLLTILQSKGKLENY
ncbi:MAG: hypothetical protein N4J56_005200 [Chroococcidiopsis sp. SAG 2025]|nr:hypothetical protein [Chroococcidiopsis sp. SAG 2025]